MGGTQSLGALERLFSLAHGCPGKRAPGALSAHGAGPRRAAATAGARSRTGRILLAAAAEDAYPAAHGRDQHTAHRAPAARGTSGLPVSRRLGDARGARRGGLGLR